MFSTITTLKNIALRNSVNILGSSGPTLLYGHGLGCNQVMWHQVTSAFASTHRQVLFDYVGSGTSLKSAFDESRYSTLGGYVQDVLDVCDELELHSRVTFIGHSVSCSIGLLASLARPELFERMILLGPSPCFANHADYFGGFELGQLEGLLLMMESNYLGWTEYLAEMLVHAQEPESSLLQDSFCASDPEMTRTFAKACFLSDDRAILTKVKPPCLILQHRNDCLAPLSVGDFCHAQLQYSNLQILDVAGHCAHLTHPDLVIAAIREYISLPLAT